MATYEETIDIAAPAQAVWDVTVDIERWPEWTASAKKAERTVAGPLTVGSTARLWLRGAIGASTWTVTAFEPPRLFAWESRIGPGVLSTATHEIRPAGDGARVVLRVEMMGLLAGLAGLLLGRVSRQNLRTEAEGLKRACEGRG
jgi:carbon monoxide dehydrogenase subunit G